MWRLLFLVMGLLAVLLLAACGGTAPATTLAQPEDSSPEITIYKSPT